MITSYNKVKDEALEYYKEFLDAFHKMGISEDDTSLQVLKLQAERIQDDRFCLTIAGESKGDKFTFINAYLGAEILPMNIRQCTGAVVEVAYGKKFVLHAVYANGQKKDVSGEEKIKKFVMDHVALDDKYRGIPAALIDHEIIVKYRDKKAGREVIEAFLKDVACENIHGLSSGKYNGKIKNYIKEKQYRWRDVVIKMVIEYPFEDEEMRGIRIIDSPCVKTAGSMADVTAEYVESADAILFLQSFEDSVEFNRFKSFLESKRVDKYKNALFLILPHAAERPETETKKAFEEFVNLFACQEDGSGQEQIMLVDSKAKFYYNAFQHLTAEKIKDEMKELVHKHVIELFLKDAWLGSKGEKDAFLKELNRLSHFDTVNQSLNFLRRKIDFMALSELFDQLLKVYEQKRSYLDVMITNYTSNVEDLSRRVGEIEGEIADIEIRMNEEAAEIKEKYAGENGIIAQRAEDILGDYIMTMKIIDSYDISYRDKLELLKMFSLRRVKHFIEFEQEMLDNIVAECNDLLNVPLSNKTLVPSVLSESDFSPDVVTKIREEMKRKATKTYNDYSVLFKPLSGFEKKYIFSRSTAYKAAKYGIIERLDCIKNLAIKELRLFVQQTLTVYANELIRKHTEAKKRELHEVEDNKKKIEQSLAGLTNLKAQEASLEPKIKQITARKGGIDSYLQ
ncbi:dynamin family protein [Megasphaera sp.]|uniref:dynamin family protein n=3 Tax=Megasphaera TaxID=906 RepID=UPI001D1EFA3B|nr:dynamin family protein [Megasphaera sp.]MBS6789294.1 dynamin family protein [Megasphaera sp.]